VHTCSAGECGRTIYTSSSQAETQPNAVEPDVDYSAEPPTLVVFSFEEVAQGVMLTITESGFEQIPPGTGKSIHGERERLERSREPGLPVTEWRS
jgi:hypothetical protein